MRLAVMLCGHIHKRNTGFEMARKRPLLVGAAGKGESFGVGF
jgi:hypothetical protein